MDTIFMNSKIVKHPILIDYYSVLQKINLKRSGKYVALSNLSIYYTRKNIKRPYNKLKI